jgi:hypothetical protein
LVLPAAAAADFDVRAFSVTPSGLQAGSHPDVTISAAFTPYDAANPPEHVRDLRISLPPGLAGDPTSAERCTKAAFTADGCPAASRVGSTSVRTVIPLLVIGLPVDATGDVYNLVPGAGEPARLGVVVRPPLGASKVFIESPVAIRQADGGLDSIITGMPSTVGLPVGESEMWIEAMSLTLEAPFASLPTSCKPAQASIAAVSGAGTASSRQADPFTPTGRDKVPFTPRLEATATLTVEKRRLRLHVAALRGRPLQRVRLALPRGVRLRRTAVARADGTTLRRVRGRVVVVRPAAARHVTIAGMLNHRLRKRRAFVVETLDSTGRVVRQRLKRRG